MWVYYTTCTVQGTLKNLSFYASIFQRMKSTPHPLSPEKKILLFWYVTSAKNNITGKKIRPLIRQGKCIDMKQEVEQMLLKNHDYSVSRKSENAPLKNMALTQWVMLESLWNTIGCRLL